MYFWKWIDLDPKQYILYNINMYIYIYAFFVSMCIPWELNPQPLRC